jgi:hypothetical protein
MLLLLAAAGCRVRTPKPQPPAIPQALDPLTDTERALAEKVARADSRVADLIGASAVVAQNVWFAPKSADGQAVPERHAELLFAIASGEYGVRALVRLGASAAVVEATRIDARSVPITDAEAQLAWQIAREDEAVRAKVANRMEQVRPQAMRSYSEDPNDPCHRGRCMYLLLRVGNAYLEGVAVTVELNSRRVLPERSRLQ